MLLLKHSVTKDNVNPAIWFALGVISLLHEQQTGMSLTVTSLTDNGHHIPTSLHPLGFAVDVRLFDISTAARLAFVQSCRALLAPSGFHVEFAHKPEHMHVEWRAEDDLPWARYLLAP